MTGRIKVRHTYMAAIGTAAITRRSDRKRRSSSADLRVALDSMRAAITDPNYVGVRRGRGSSMRKTRRCLQRHRLGRVPSGDTLSGFCAAYGRCLLMEANLCVNCGGPDAERNVSLPPSAEGVKTLAVGGLRRTMECRSKGDGVGRSQLSSWGH